MKSANEFVMERPALRKGIDEEAAVPIKSILFVVDPKEFLVRESVLVDAQGNTNHFTFDGVEVNTKVADSLFKWSPPAGHLVAGPGLQRRFGFVAQQHLLHAGQHAADRYHRLEIPPDGDGGGW